MPLPRFMNLEESKREALLDAAAREFGAHGFEGASVNRIVAEAGLSKGALYYYFENKEDLYTTTIVDAVELMNQALDDVFDLDPGVEFWDEMVNVYKSFLGQVHAHPRLALLAPSLLTAWSEADRMPALQAAFEGARVWLDDLLTRGQQVGAIRTDIPREQLLPLVMLLGEAFDRWTMASFAAEPPSDADAFALQMTDLWRRLLSP